MALEDDFSFGFLQNTAPKKKQSKGTLDKDEAMWGDMLGDTLRGAGKFVKRIAENTVTESDSMRFGTNQQCCSKCRSRKK